jgi:hypothetical protein
MISFKPRVRFYKRLRSVEAECQRKSETEKWILSQAAGSG